MSKYSNKVGVGIAELARITFFEEFNNNTEEVVIVCMHIEVFKNMIGVMQQTIDEFEKRMEEQRLANRKAN